MIQPQVKLFIIYLICIRKFYLYLVNNTVYSSSNVFQVTFKSAMTLSCDRKLNSKTITILKLT